MMDRRFRWPRWGWALALALVLPPGGVRGADAVDTAVQRGVRFLLAQQQESGSITDPERGSRHRTVMTALAVLALTSVGHQPVDATPEGQALSRALSFVLDPANQTPEGYFGNEDGSRMYGHGITTLAVTEMLGMGVNEEMDRQLRLRGQRAIEMILRSQRVRKHAVRYQGGWRYTPESGDADLSVTVWQLMALRSARNAGLPVPKEAIEAAVGYLKRSYYSQRDQAGRPLDMRSGFGYQPGRGPEYATAAAGLLALQVCGEYDAPEVVGTADWLLDLTRGGGEKDRRRREAEYGGKWFFYGTYYFAQGMQKRRGEHARHAREFTESLLVANQAEDGSWLTGDGQERSAGRVYTTSLAILSLSVRWHYLPIYQY